MYKRTINKLKKTIMKYTNYINRPWNKWDFIKSTVLLIGLIITYHFLPYLITLTILIILYAFIRYAIFKLKGEVEAIEFDD